jgi:TLC domain
MEARLAALMRKAGPHTPEVDEVKDKVLDFLVKKVSRKSEYESVFGTPEDAEDFSIQHQLSDVETKLIISMAISKDIFVPNPILDHILTVLFLVELYYLSKAMYQRDLLWLFLFNLLIVDAVVHRVKHLSKVFGLWLCNYLLKTGRLVKNPLLGKIQMKKWQEQSWQLVIHVFASLLGWYILSKQTWWSDGASIWLPNPLVVIDGWPILPDDQKNFWSFEVKLQYISALTVWIYTCIVHRFFDERRKDYFVMYFHHIITIALVGCSFSCEYLRIGVLVMFVHDVSDIFVDLLKLVNYIQLEGPNGFYATEISYVLCVLSWLYWRLYEYPFRVIKGSLFWPFVVIDDTLWGYLVRWYNSENSLYSLIFNSLMPFFIEMNILLILLLCLHIYWFHLFLMIGYKIITESSREASRQEYEGDSDTEDAEPNQLRRNVNASNEKQEAKKRKEEEKKGK